MKVIVTGGAGFIGSCIIRMLNDEGIDDIFVVDNIGSSPKWGNLRNKKYIEYYNKGEFLAVLPKLNGITHIIHMGACSSTTEVDFDYLYKNNFNYSVALWKYAVENKISFIYASSAATYGDGREGFNDKTLPEELRPLNRYGYLKNKFDYWTQSQKDRPQQVVGLKFFNVYGPNEYHKGSMASMVYHGFNQINDSNEIRLFKSYNDNYKDGGQLRDFIYVKDVCKVVRFFMESPEKNGVFNIGTGKANTFESLAEAVFKAVGKNINIEYVNMPDNLRDKYQYFTEAKLDKLREVGYTGEFFSLDSGVSEYVNNHLSKKFEVY